MLRDHPPEHAAPFASALAYGVLGRLAHRQAKRVADALEARVAGLGRGVERAHPVGEELLQRGRVPVRLRLRLDALVEDVVAERVHEPALQNKAHAVAHARGAGKVFGWQPIVQRRAPRPEDKRLGQQLALALDAIGKARARVPGRPAPVVELMGGPGRPSVPREQCGSIRGARSSRPSRTPPAPAQSWRSMLINCRALACTAARNQPRPVLAQKMPCWARPTTGRPSPRRGCAQ